MRTFVPTFLAILAAAAVILTALWAKQRIDQWELAKKMCYAQTETELKMMQLRTTREQSEMSSMAQSGDVSGVARRVMASLDAMDESRANIAEINRKLVAILDAKPFGLPLTAQEKKDVEAAKRFIAEVEKAEADRKDKAKADEARMKAEREKEKAEREKEEAEQGKRDAEEEKRKADFRKAHGLAEPIYPTIEEAFASPTPSPYGWAGELHQLPSHE